MGDNEEKCAVSKNSKKIHARWPRSEYEKLHGKIGKNIRRN